MHSSQKNIFLQYILLGGWRLSGIYLWFFIASCFFFFWKLWWAKIERSIFSMANKFLKAHVESIFLTSELFSSFKKIIAFVILPTKKNFFVHRSTTNNFWMSLPDFKKKRKKVYAHKEFCASNGKFQIVTVVLLQENEI